MMNLKGQYRQGRQPDRQTAGESVRVPLGLRVEVPLLLFPTPGQMNSHPPADLTQVRTEKLRPPAILPAPRRPDRQTDGLPRPLLYG